MVASTRIRRPPAYDKAAVIDPNRATPYAAHAPSRAVVTTMGSSQWAEGRSSQARIPGVNSRITLLLSMATTFLWQQAKDSMRRRRSLP